MKKIIIVMIVSCLCGCSSIGIKNEKKNLSSNESCYYAFPSKNYDFVSIFDIISNKEIAKVQKYKDKEIESINNYENNFSVLWKNKTESKDKEEPVEGITVESKEEARLLKDRGYILELYDYNGKLIQIYNFNDIFKSKYDDLIVSNNLFYADENSLYACFDFNGDIYRCDSKKHNLETFLSAKDNSIVPSSFEVIDDELYLVGNSKKTQQTSIAKYSLDGKQEVLQDLEYKNEKPQFLKTNNFVYLNDVEDAITHTSLGKVQGINKKTGEKISYDVDGLESMFSRITLDEKYLVSGIQKDIMNPDENTYVFTTYELNSHKKIKENKLVTDKKLIDIYLINDSIYAICSAYGELQSYQFEMR